MEPSEKLREQYPDVEELLDNKVPKSLFGEIAITEYVDSDHAHDKGTIEISTHHGTEFMVMNTVVEE
eukprot:8830845-Ditylum_brightwellii.AAC.1